VMEPAKRTCMCVFVPGRACPVDLDEVPLDLCRLCMEAWRAHMERVMIRPVRREQEVSVEGPGPSRADKTRPLTLGGSAQPALAHETLTRQPSLSELDKLFWEGKIDVSEYIKRRKEAVNSLANERSPFSSFEEALERLGVEGPAQGAVFVVERGRVKAAYPGGAILPEELEGEPLEALRELYASLGRLGEGVCLEVGGRRIACLGRRGRKIALLVLDSSAKLEDFAEGVKEARVMLEERDDWEEALPLLYRIVFGARPIITRS